MADRWDRAGGGAALATASVVSVQFGAALATTLFPAAGALGVVALRSFGAAAVLLALSRPWRRGWTAGELRRAASLGVVIVAMNACLYLAIERLALATGVTLELLGPLTLAIATATSWGQRLWALPAAAGVVLIGRSLNLGDLPGVVFALAAAGGWAAYIVLNRRMGTSTGLQGLGLAAVRSWLFPPAWAPPERPSYAPRCWPEGWPSASFRRPCPTASTCWPCGACPPRSSAFSPA